MRFRENGGRSARFYVSDGNRSLDSSLWFRENGGCLARFLCVGQDERARNSVLWFREDAVVRRAALHVGRGGHELDSALYFRENGGCPTRFLCFERDGRELDSALPSRINDACQAALLYPITLDRLCEKRSALPDFFGRAGRICGRAGREREGKRPARCGGTILRSGTRGFRRRRRARRKWRARPATAPCAYRPPRTDCPRRGARRRFQPRRALSA